MTLTVLTFPNIEELNIVEIQSTYCFRCSHPRCSVIKGVLKHFAKFTGKHLRKSLFLIKLQV